MNRRQKKKLFKKLHGANPDKGERLKGAQLGQLKEYDSVVKYSKVMTRRRLSRMLKL